MRKPAGASPEGPPRILRAQLLSYEYERDRVSHPPRRKDDPAVRVIKLLVALLVCSVAGLGFVSFLLYQDFSRLQSSVEERMAAAEEARAVLQDQVTALATLYEPDDAYLYGSSAQLAITVPDLTNVHIGPDSSYYIPVTLSRGTPVLIRYTEGGWDHVQIPSSGRTGYIKDTCLLRVGSTHF